LTTINGNQQCPMEIHPSPVSFSPFPMFETQRLILRRLTVHDVAEVFAIRSDAETMRYIPRPVAKSKQDALDYIKVIEMGVEDNDFIHWAICLKGDPKLIGLICLIRFQPENFRTEVGYILSPEARGLGLMTEALQAVVSYTFNVLKYHSLEAVIDPRNLPSEAILIRAGFIKEAQFKERRYYDGAFLDDAVYSLLNN
jgi:ribosomal-protein-alanine N-acetyltransferase